MRRTSALCLVLSVAACAPRPQPAPPPQKPVEAPRTERNQLVGLTPQDLVGRFGSPALQIREGTSLKLQFRGRQCVLDAYLYPQGGAGVMRVTHVDARSPNGLDTDQAACISALENPS